jgi:hypothetical protein
MADNVAVTPGTGATIATDDVGGAQYQRVKVDLGGDGAASPLLRGQQTGANSVPVVLPSDQAAIPVTDNSGSLTVDGTVTANAGAGTFTVGDGGGSLTVDGTVTANAGTGTFTTGGTAAHDAAVSGNPVLIAARANANEPTAVSADGDVTHLWADLLGRLVVLPGHPSPEPPVAVNATASGNTTVIAAPGASLSLYICKGVINNAGAANVVVLLQDGAAGTTRFRAEVASEGGGVPFDFGARGWKLTANTLLNANLSAAGDVNVNVMEFYIAP